MLRIGTLRGSGRKRASRKLAALRHPAVLSACGLHCSALRPRDPIQTSSPALAQGRASYVESGVRLIRQQRSRKLHGSSQVTNAVGLAFVFGPVARRRRHGAATGVRRTAPVRTACLRIAKAIRVLYASRRRCVSECSGAAGAMPGCLFLCLLLFGQANESKSRSSAKPKVRQTREPTRTRERTKDSSANHRSP